MSGRRGVTLIEVLVATVLLAVGIHGTLGALAAAQRLHRGARERDAVAARALDRLSWFAQEACVRGDTLAEAVEPPGVSVRWSTAGTANHRRLHWEGRVATSRAAPLTVRAEWLCD